MASTIFRRSAYLDDAQRQYVAAERVRPLWRGEWPTWLLIAVIHGGWFGTLACWDRIGPVLGTPLMIWWTAWYMSLQHELIHGHPTRRPWLNALFGTLPLAVWYPYGLYRDSHLRHHDDTHLTMPERDTESWYVSPAAWGEMGPLRRRLHWFNKTFFGRLLVGPALAISATWIDAVRQPLRGEWRDVPMWLTHLTLLAALLWWVQHNCGVGAAYFLVAISYPAQSLAMVRSFYEHRPAVRAKERIVLNEADPLLRLLFLNNNLHLVHHDLPSLPWYLLPRVYRARRADYLARNGHFHFDGYGDLAHRHGWRAIDAPVHPHVPEAT
jgi:fatty acid desaturase